MDTHERELKCPNCNSEDLLYGTEDLTISYKGKSKVLSDVEYIECNNCSESFYGRSWEKVIDRETTDFEREQDNLLTSSEIKEIRKSFKLTQEQLSQLLGMGLKTIARYENGRVTQSRATDLLIRLIRDNPSTINYLEQYKSSGQIQEDASGG